MARHDRIHSFADARTGRPAGHRLTPSAQQRALVLPDDPPWLHEGLTYRLLLRGELVDLFTIGSMARGVGRSPEASAAGSV